MEQEQRCEASKKSKGKQELSSTSLSLIISDCDDLHIVTPAASAPPQNIGQIFFWPTLTWRWMGKGILENLFLAQSS